MPETENKPRKKDNKAITIAGIAIILLGIAIGAILAIQSRTIDESFFESNDNKYVLTRDAKDDSLFGEIKTYTVAMVKDDTINHLAIYHEFESGDKAKEAFSEISSIYQEGKAESVKNVFINSKYVIVEYAESEYANMSATEFKSWIETNQKSENDNHETQNEGEAEPTATEE